MRCSKAREYVSWDLDAVLPPDATGKLREHLDQCGDCRQYRTDLLLGQRLMAATEPELPENFEWKLQLKLNHALQQTAGEAHYPWQSETADRWAWLRNFGAATAVGLAAVLALAMFFGPETTGLGPARIAQRNDSSPVTATASDRRALFQPGNGGLYRSTTQRLVSGDGRTVDGGSAYLGRSWAGPNTEDLITIRRLNVENRRLNNLMLQYQRSNTMLRAQLDTSGTHALDLQHNH